MHSRRFKGEGTALMGHRGCLVKVYATLGDVTTGHVRPGPCPRHLRARDLRRRYAERIEVAEHGSGGLDVMSQRQGMRADRQRIANPQWPRHLTEGSGRLPGEARSRKLEVCGQTAFARCDRGRGLSGHRHRGTSSEAG